MSHADEFNAIKLRHGGEWGCTACPVEAEGRLSDGCPWYFRARGGEWAMHIGKPDDEDAVCKRAVSVGEDPWFGWMPAKHAAAIIHALLDCREAEAEMLRTSGQKRDRETGVVTKQ